MKEFLQSSLWRNFVHILQTHLKRNYLRGSAAGNPWNSKDTVYFSRGIKKLNPLFTTERDRRALNYFSDPVLRSGYLAYYLPVNLIKTVMILERGFADSVKWPKKIHVADIGAGPLTMSLGFLLWFTHRLGKKIHDHEIIIEAFEQNTHILKDGSTIFKSLLEQIPLLRPAKISLNIKQANILRHRFVSRPFDLILLGNFFNEVPERQNQWELAQKILDNTSTDGTRLIILEPGTKKSARDLQALRDQLIEHSRFSVLAPCLHQNTCPLNLEAKGDWCHFTQNWQTPDFIRDMDHYSGLEKKWLVYSYLVMQKNTPAPEHPDEEFVAITDLFKKSRCNEIVGCGPPGRVRFILQSREYSENNRSLLNLRRGVCFMVRPLKVNSPARGEKFCNLGADTLVKTEYPSSVTDGLQNRYLFY